LQAAIDEALKASGGPVSGEFPVAEVARLDVEVNVPSLNMATRNTAPSNEPPVRPSTPSAQVPAVVATEDAREKLLLTAEEIQQATMRLRESEHTAALPQSLETLVRAVRAVGGHESAVAIEVLSNCMEVVNSYDQWRGSVVEHLRARPQPLPMLRNESTPPIEVEAARPARMDRRPLAFAAMLLMGAVAAGSAWGSLRQVTRAVASPTRPPTAASALTPNPMVIAAQDLPRVENVRIAIRASPVQSRIVIDQAVCENPCVATLPKDGTSHTIHLEADGHLSQDHAFDANGDALFVVALEPHATPARPVTARGAAPNASSTVAESTASAGFRSATAQSADPSVRRIIPANPYYR
ncbi:MAG: hypothetical protein M3O46_19305, partial [Myxococcota bacterium]|nr:hypothetical protein [Myxococcota bacterium]